MRVHKCVQVQAVLCVCARACVCALRDREGRGYVCLNSFTTHVRRLRRFNLANLPLASAATLLAAQCVVHLQHPHNHDCMQLLMGAADFCALMHALAVLAPGVDAKRFPTVASYGRFGEALLTSPPSASASDGEGGSGSGSKDGEEGQQQKQERGWQVSPPKGKRGKVCGGVWCLFVFPAGRVGVPWAA